MDLDSFRSYATLTPVCRSIAENPGDLKLLEKLKNIIVVSPRSFVKAAQKPIIACFYTYMKNLSTNKKSFSSQGRKTIVETLRHLLDKLTIENSTIFFNFYSFLLFELYDYSKHQVLPTTEEYKTELLICMISLVKSASFEIIEELYVKKNVPKFSQIIYVCGELAKKEKSRNIRCTAIECIMALAKVTDTDDLSDIVLRNKCAEMFMFFLPGLSSTFTEIALADLKVGHKAPMMSIKAYGRIISLVMQNNDPHESNLTVKYILSQNEQTLKEKTKWKNQEEVDQYLENISRNIEWYRVNDEKLNVSLKKFASLTYHSHINVRLALVSMASDITKHCLATMPQSICTLIEILIILSQDDNEDVKKGSNQVIDDLSSKLSSESIKVVFESLEEGFYNTIISLPRKFNSVDDSEKISALNLLIGYIKVFGKHRLNEVLLSPTVLNKLIQSLLHISELKRKNVSVLEEYTLKDINLEPDFRTPWIEFFYFKDDTVKYKIELLCIELAKNNCCDVIFDSLLDTFLYDLDKRKEAVYLMNSHILGLEGTNSEHTNLIKNIMNIYTDKTYNVLNMMLDPDEYTLEEIQNNVILTCLITEGIGKVSLILKENFKNYLLKSLYLVLEKAGSGHPLIKAAGLLTLNNITCSCAYSDITDLINSNFDFFSYHVERKLIKNEEKEDVLNVLSIVLKYSNIDVLVPMSNIVEEILLQSCDRFRQKHATAYLKTFEMFILSIRRWFKIEVKVEPIKSRREKEVEHEDFKVTGINQQDDFSDDIMEGKTAEELYKEDMEKKQQEEIEYEEDEYKKPEPPVHIKLTSSILRRSLHFLPSKDQTRRILVLNILEKGIEILRDWEDELLPVVHQIWSPLVQRFKEDMDPTIFMLSVRLLKTMGRLSKEFIRMRTVRDVLPRIIQTLVKLSTSSYMQDKGIAYRYTQNYKLQNDILKNLGMIVYCIDFDSKAITDIMDSVSLYLSDKQPRELQAAAVEFFSEMAVYDLETVQQKVASMQSTMNAEYDKNIERVKTMLNEIKK